MDKEEVYEILNRAYFTEDCHERDVLETIESLFRCAGSFVDIGASLGQYSLFASRAMKPDGRIWSIEADPIRFEELERNCRVWEEETGITFHCVHAALSDQKGVISFYSTDSNVSGGLFVHPVSSEGVEWREITVPSLTLDALFENETPDFVKMDVEGAELRVLRGAEKLLARNKTCFLIEVHSWADPEGQSNREEVFSFMRSFGYHTAPLRGQVLFHPDRFTAMRWKLRSKAHSALQRLARWSSAASRTHGC